MPQSVDALVIEHVHVAEAIVAKFAATQRNFDSEEALGDALLALIQCSARYEARRGATFPTFAWRSIEGAVRQGHYLRSGLRTVGTKRRRKWSQVYLYAPEEALAQKATADRFTDQLLDIRDALRAVQPRYRELLLLAAAGYTAAEIAAREGTSERSVRAGLHQARKQMRQLCSGRIWRNTQSLRRAEPLKRAA